MNIILFLRQKTKADDGMIHTGRFGVLMAGAFGIIVALTPAEPEYREATPQRIEWVRKDEDEEERQQDTVYVGFPPCQTKIAPEPVYHHQNNYFSKN